MRRRLAFCLLLGALGACWDRPAERPAATAEATGVAPIRRLFLITIDTLRADHVSAYGYPRLTSPRFDALARRAWVFDRAIAQWPKTGSSFASMFLGRYPQSSGLTHAAAVELPASQPPLQITLPRFLRDHGFTNVAVVSNPMLMTKLGWAAEFDEYHETWTTGAGGKGEGEDAAAAAGGVEAIGDDPSAMRRYMDAGRVNALALPLLERRRGSERLFAWIHYSDPHGPYLLPEGSANPFLGDETWRRSAAETIPKRLDRQRRLGQETDRRFYVAQYDANILVADEAIGSVLDQLEALGLLSNAAVVITSDHGESLGEHDSWFEHGPLPYNTTSRVPLLIWRPGHEPAAGRRVVRPVELIDLFPTVRDWVEPAAALPQLEGRSWAPLLREAAETAEPTELTADAAPAAAFSEAGRRPRTHFRSLQEGRYKLIYNPDPKDLVRRAVDPKAWQLFDLTTDPLETTDLLAQDGRDLPPAVFEEVRRLRRRLLAWSKEVPFSAEDVEEANQRDREVRKALRALGYVQ